jgi:hypothetical protein
MSGTRRFESSILHLEMVKGRKGPLIFPWGMVGFGGHAAACPYGRRTPAFRLASIRFPNKIAFATLPAGLSSKSLFDKIVASLSSHQQRVVDVKNRL